MALSVEKHHKLRRHPRDQRADLAAFILLLGRLGVPPKPDAHLPKQIGPYFPGLGECVAGAADSDFTTTDFVAVASPKFLVARTIPTKGDEPPPL
jgi:hypothetical protein